MWTKSFANGVERSNMGVEVGTSNGWRVVPDD